MPAAETVERARLGRTDLMAPKICFGTSGLGSMPDTYGYAVDEERARATVRAVLDGPAPFLDASRNYGFGRSEERVGMVIRERGGFRKASCSPPSSTATRDTNRFDAARDAPLAGEEPCRR